MSTSIDLARQRKAIIRVNRGQEIDLSILVNNSEGSAFNFSGYSAELLVYNSFGKTKTPEYTISVTLSTGLMRLTHDGIDRRKENMVYRLWVTNPEGYRQPWLNGSFLVLDSEYDHAGYSPDETITISPNGDNVTIVLSPVSELFEVGVPVETFDTELTFDFYKDLATIDGGDIVFTHSASGHKNGVGILARINQPSSVTFPDEYEIMNGSDSINSEMMNIIIFRYFEDYDGAGNDKVLFIIKNQTPIL